MSGSQSWFLNQLNDPHMCIISVFVVFSGRVKLMYIIQYNTYSTGHSPQGLFRASETINKMTKQNNNC